MVELIEVEPGRWRVKRDTPAPARSDLPRPYIISDEMPLTEQVDGRFYSSKAKFRAVGRALGLTEVGNEKFKPKRRATDDRAVKTKRRQAIKVAIEKYKAGHRAG
jgi:hypothetical protein